MFYISGVVCQLVHGVVQASQDVRRVGLALRVGLSGNGVVDGCAGRGDGVDAGPENAQVLHDGDRHLGHVTQGVQPGVDQHGGEHLCLFAGVLHDPAHLHLDLSGREVGFTPVLQALLSVREPLVDGGARLALETLVCAVVPQASLGLVNGIHRGAVFEIEARERLVCLCVLHELHEALVHRTLNHCSILPYPQKSELPLTTGLLLSCEPAEYVDDEGVVEAVLSVPAA